MRSIICCARATETHNSRELPNDDEMLPDGTVRVHTHTDLPPVPIDAGVADAAPATIDSHVDLS
jgi:hypothetical protein